MANPIQTQHVNYQKIQAQITFEEKYQLIEQGPKKLTRNK
jgi:hypothetical protein